MIIGGLAGLVIGGFIGIMVYNFDLSFYAKLIRNPRQFARWSAVSCAVIGVIAFALIGMMLGW